jgi:hypothetical protein
MLLLRLIIVILVTTIPFLIITHIPLLFIILPIIYFNPKFIDCQAHFTFFNFIILIINFRLIVIQSHELFVVKYPLIVYFHLYKF